MEKSRKSSLTTKIIKDNLNISERSIRKKKATFAETERREREKGNFAHIKYERHVVTRYNEKMTRNNEKRIRESISLNNYNLNKQINSTISMKTVKPMPTDCMYNDGTEI